MEPKIMSDSKQSPPLKNRPMPDLKNPFLAGILAWLLPGLGHWYQGRKGKAVLFFCCIMPIFVAGCYFGSDKEYGAARVVYMLWQNDGGGPNQRREGGGMDISESRLYFIPQACIGLAAVPALIQSNRVSGGDEPYWGGFMAPPSSNQKVNPGKNPTLNQLIARLHRYFDIGTIYTVVAGLMNVLVIFDALRGPLYEEEEGEKQSKNKTDPKKAS